MSIDIRCYSTVDCNELSIKLKYIMQKYGNIY